MADSKLKVKTQSAKVTVKDERQMTNDLVIAKVVRTTLSNSRHATAKTKKRGEVSGGGKKPWKQKGTGRARVGSSRSPIWRGGGVVFGPTGSQNFDLKATKKEKQIALKAAFEAKKSVAQNIPAPKLSKTKEAAEFLKKNNLAGKVLLLIDQKTGKGQNQSKDVTELKRVFKNIPGVIVRLKVEANAYEVLNSNSIAILLDKKESKEASRQAGVKEIK